WQWQQRAEAPTAQSPSASSPDTRASRRTRGHDPLLKEWRLTEKPLETGMFWARGSRVAAETPSEPEGRGAVLTRMVERKPVAAQRGAEGAVSGWGAQRGAAARRVFGSTSGLAPQPGSAWHSRPGGRRAPPAARGATASLRGLPAAAAG